MSRYYIQSLDDGTFDAVHSHEHKNVWAATFDKRVDAELFIAAKGQQKKEAYARAYLEFFQDVIDHQVAELSGLHEIPPGLLRKGNDG